MTAPLTYQMLLEHHARDVQVANQNTQTAANRATILRAFLRANYLDVDDVVGDEMRINFLAALDRYLKSLEEAGTSARNRSNCRSAARWWKAKVCAYDTLKALEQGNATPFQTALKSALTGIEVARVAREAGVPKDMLWGWIRGKVPRASSQRFLWRIESYLGLERNSLVTISGMRPNGFKPSLGGEPTPVAYNEKLKELSGFNYFLKADEGSPLRRQWAEFLQYKTAAVPSLKRTRRGKWRFSPCPITPNTDANWWAFLRGREVASARWGWTVTARYLGWLRLSRAQGGNELEERSVHTLGWLAIPDFIEEHLEWQRNRMGGRSQVTLQMLAFFQTLVRPVHGYLRQRVDIQQTLPEQYRNESWDLICDRQFELLQQLYNAYEGEVTVTRDSFAPIQHILHLPQPMEAIADMVQRIKADRPVGEPRRELVWSRDLFLVQLLISNPLRKRTLAHLTWRADNTGELYQRPDGSWWIRICRTKFKNTAGAAGDRDYDSQVHPKVRKALEHYLFESRPKLLRAPSDLVFLARPSHGKTDHAPWSSLSERIKVLTARYLPRCIGTGAHSFRHIVATSILKADGGDYKTAALILNDRQRTVENHYAHLRSNDGAEKMAELLKGPFARM